MNRMKSVIKWITKTYKKYKEIINYLIVGGMTTIVSIVSYSLYRIIIHNYIICTILSWITAVLFAYFANRFLVFNSKNKNKIKEFIKFLSCRLLTLGTEIISMFLLVEILKLNDVVSKILVQFLIVILNYIFSKLLVFNQKKL